MAVAADRGVVTMHRHDTPVGLTAQVRAQVTDDVVGLPVPWKPNST